jgi:molecular chaperone DnaK
MKLGIDLGTTNTLAAYLDDDRPRLLVNSRGSVSTPSVVGLDRSGNVLVGESARNQLQSAPERTVAAVKRLMGHRRTVPLGEHRFSPEEVSARILLDIRRTAETHFGRGVSEAVVTVPAHFDDRQRAATVEAGLLGGFRRISLLNEPTAAALPYAERSRNRERIVVFDFGGGTLDVSCLERQDTDYVVQASIGDGALGGRDIDALLYRRFSDTIRERLDIDPDDDPVIAQTVLQLAERGKIELSEVSETTVTVPFLTGTAGQHLSFDLRRAELEELIAPLVARIRRLTAQAIAEAGFARSGFDTLVLAGGSSRLPVVRRVLAEEYGVPPAHRINPEEVVAVGAALYADSGGAAGFRLREALSHTLSIELSDGTCVPVIRKNQSIPASRTRIFTTVSDRQAEAEIHLVQGDERLAVNNRSLGRFTLTNIENAPQGRARISVTVSVDDDGLVTVRAGDRSTGVQRQITTRPRSEVVRHALTGDVAQYLASLVRRIRTLARAAGAELRDEMEQILELIDETEDGVGDDMVTILETLILEAVAEQAQAFSPGANRAAS